MALRPLPLAPGFATSRLQLQAFTPDDREELQTVLAASREHLERFLAMPADEELATWLQVAASLHRRGVRGSYGIRLPDGALIGGAQIDLLDGGRAAIGFWLAPTHTGNGYATEAAGALARVAFDKLGVRRVEMLCNPQNEASHGVATRLGFERVNDELWVLEGAAVAWDDLAGRITEQHEVASRGRSSFTLAATAGRAPVRVVRLELQGRLWVELCATVAPAGCADPTEMLAHNGKLAIGALCIRGDKLILRHSGPPEALAGDEAQRAIDLVGHEAARLTRVLVRPTNGAMFDIFAE